MNDHSDKPKILLTGSTGFIGTHTAHHLVDQGYRLRCLVRKTSDTSRLPKGVELTEGHLLNFDSLRKAVKDCQGVIHVGGVVRVKRVRDFYVINRDGTSNIVKAAREEGVERFVLCSSLAAAGPSSPGSHRRWDDEPQPVTEYGKSKLSGEEMLQKGAGEMWWSIVRPPSVYGPWDIAFLTLVKWVKRGFKLRIGDGKTVISLIHASDLARALTLTIEADRPSGKIWFATDGADHDLPELTEAIERALDREARWINIPKWVTPAVAWLIEMFAEFRGDAALLSRAKLAELMQPAWTCDDEPFREATGYREKFNLTEGMAQTVEWYLDHKWI